MDTAQSPATPPEGVVGQNEQSDMDEKVSNMVRGQVPKLPTDC